MEPQNHGSDEYGLLNKSNKGDASASDKWVQGSGTGRDLLVVKIARLGDTHRHRVKSHFEKCGRRFPVLGLKTGGLLRVEAMS